MNTKQRQIEITAKITKALVESLDIAEGSDDPQSLFQVLYLLCLNGTNEVADELTPTDLKLALDFYELYVLSNENSRSVN